MHDSKKAWRDWYSRNREGIVEKLRKKRQADPQSHNQAIRDWMKANPEKVKQQASRDSLYRKMRRNGIGREEAARVAGVKLKGRLFDTSFD
jgi:hypothetical protein